jgi:hypothetical protein
MSAIDTLKMEANRGIQVNIAVWTCLTLSGLAVASKIITKLTKHHDRLSLRYLQLDDGLLFAALVRKTHEHA